MLFSDVVFGRKNTSSTPQLETCTHIYSVESQYRYNKIITTDISSIILFQLATRVLNLQLLRVILGYKCNLKSHAHMSSE